MQTLHNLSQRQVKTSMIYRRGYELSEVYVMMCFGV